MEAMIFAAGIGSRLKPFTLTQPKALAPVAGIPALQRCMTRLHTAAQVNHMVINIHHFPDEIRRYIRENPMPDVDITFADESGLLLDTGGGLLNAATLFHSGVEPVLLHNADIVTDAPLDEMISSFKESGADAMLLTDPHRSSSRLLWFDKKTLRLVGWTNSNDGETRPAGFSPDPTRQFPAAFNGVHIVSLKKIIPMLKRYAGINGPVFSLTPFYLWAITRGADVMAFVPEDPYRWHDIGTPAKLAAASCDFGGS